MSSLLVIGGTGFFGKSILDLFIRSGLQNYGVKKITIVARHIDEFKLNYPELINDNVRLISLDISTCNSLPDADLVVHAAASSNARDCIIDSNSQKSNIEVSTINYCDLAEKYHRNAKIVYCSSGAVYGQQPRNVDSMAEDFPFQDVSGMVEYKRDYAIGKRVSENAIQKLGLAGLNVSIARCFAFYGKYLPKDQHFAYGNFIGAAEQGKNIEVHAKHQVIRSYMHADDMVHALIQIALEADPNCPIYNVGSGYPIEIRDLAKKIANEYGVGISFNNIDNENIDRYIPNVTKLNTLKSKLNL
jgi:nucleoside-diphosphate-sugar epimerase